MDEAILVITTYGEDICTRQYLSFIEMCGTVVTFLLDLELGGYKHDSRYLSQLSTPDLYFENMLCTHIIFTVPVV